MFNQKPIHYPNLKTILLIEAFLEKQKSSVSKNYILNNIQKKIMRPTLNVALEYLELSGKISINKHGVEWIFDENKKLKMLLRKAADSIT